MSDKSPSSIDAARAQNPELGFSFYALTPGGPVTLEIVTPDEELFRFDGATEADVLALAFPVQAQPAEPTASIFD